MLDNLATSTDKKNLEDIYKAKVMNVYWANDDKVVHWTLYYSNVNPLDCDWVLEYVPLNPRFTKRILTWKLISRWNHCQGFLNNLIPLFQDIHHSVGFTLQI